jgi:general secretion pathway protein I
MRFDFVRLCSQSRGFTLIEALAALAVMAVVLTSIGALMASNLRAPVKIGEHIELIAALRSVEAALPERSKLGSGILTGELHGLAWSVESAPFPADYVNPKAGQLWVPQTITMTVRSPSGGSLGLRTVRLVRPVPQQ